MAQRELEQLPNLGKTTLMLLRAIGIRTTDSLAEKGIYYAYVGMRARGFRVTTAVLFSLEGALRNLPWRNFDDEEKQALLAGLARFEKGLARFEEGLVSFEEKPAGAPLTKTGSTKRFASAAPKRAPLRTRSAQSISAAKKRGRGR